jgi:hypothetical protein
VLPVGTATLVYAFSGTLSMAVTGFSNVAVVGGLLAGGLGVDALVALLRPTALRPARLRAFAALAPVVTWTAYVVVAWLTSPPVYVDPTGRHPEGAVELYTGVPVLQALVGLLLAVVLLPAHEGRGDGAPV